MPASVDTFHVSLITYCDLPDLDPDDRLVLDILLERGLRCQSAVWNDPNIDWAKAGLCVLRSTWDYHLCLEDFLDWIQRVSTLTTILNSPSVLRWNIHKSYLRTLQELGLPVIETAFFEKHSEINLQAVLQERNWHTAVIKPTVGLSSYGVRKVTIDNRTDADQICLNELLKTGAAMLQPYMESVERRGEIALIFFGGEYSHAVRKTPFQTLAPAGHAGQRAATASPGEIALAQRVLKSLPETTLYARVDVVLDGKEQPLIMEVELTEPSLFLSLNAGAPKRFADAIMRFAAMTNSSCHVLP